MARRYRKLTYQDRVYLQGELKKNRTATDIAEELDVHRSTIYREISKGKFHGEYNAEHAQKQIFR